ncbi:MAG: hypothetical protein IPL84_18585 [Chitinophagaceae bacterium]|nr:hypothetical protein [Chitinophagaceae bacterium]
MKKILFIILFVASTFSGVGQQYLWSTTKDTTINWGKHISADDIPNKVLEFYDYYKFYYDGSGYNKEGFFKFFEDSKSYNSSSSTRWGTLKKKINEINDLEVFAYKDNLGQGSVILVMCVTRDNVNLIVFSNNYEPNAILTGSYNKQKFLSWFKTLLN